MQNRFHPLKINKKENKSFIYLRGSILRRGGLLYGRKVLHKAVHNLLAGQQQSLGRLYESLGGVFLVHLWLEHPRQQLVEPVEARVLARLHNLGLKIFIIDCTEESRKDETCLQI